jgi:hypothetical protein
MIWKKSSFSNGTTDCVELASNDGMVYVRDSKDPEGPTLGFTKTEVLAFLRGAKAGEFDDLAM